MTGRYGLLGSRSSMQDAVNLPSRAYGGSTPENYLNVLKAKVRQEV